MVQNPTIRLAKRQVNANNHFNNLKERLEVSDHLLADKPGRAVIAQTIRNASKPKSFKSWIHYFYSHVKIRRGILQEWLRPLTEDGVLRMETRKVLWISPSLRYTSEPAAKDLIIQRLRAELLEQGKVGEQTAVLAMLMETAKLLKPYFSDYERSELKRKLENLHHEQGEEWKRIVQIRKAIQEMQAAVTVAAVGAA